MSMGPVAGDRCQQPHPEWLTNPYSRKSAPDSAVAALPSGTLRSGSIGSLKKFGAIQVAISFCSH